MKCYFASWCMVLMASILVAQPADAPNGNTPGLIVNDTFWNTADGTPLYSQGGGIFVFTDPLDGQSKYFWYGNHYHEADLYRASPVRKYKNCSFESFSLYTSTDLVNWHAEPDVLCKDALLAEGQQHLGWVGRMGVCFVKEAGVYALLAQYNNSVLVALSPSPRGPFTPYRRINMTSRIGTPNTGDQTVFVDDDGRGYLIYSYGRGRHRGYVSEIGVESETDSIGLKNCVQVFEGFSREGNCMFKRDGRYYLCASNIYGWDCSDAYYLVADSIYGPYRPSGDMAIMADCQADYAHVTQTGFFVTVKGTEQETVVYCGDRWADFANNGLGYNQWVPLSFDEEHLPIFNSLSHWTLDVHTGRWAVNRGNNYVRNGSFEADRRVVPIPNKPRQEYLRGWQTEVLSGTPVGVDVPGSPQLNHMNSTGDQKYVVGKMSMQMSDTVRFERKVSQLVKGSGTTVMPDGDYLLRAKVNVSGKFPLLKVLVGEAELNLSREPEGWHEVQLKVKVTGGQVPLVFHAIGNPHARCLVDDISLCLECQEKIND